MPNEPGQTESLSHSQLVRVNDSLKLHFEEGDFVGSQGNFVSFRACKTICESAQGELDGVVGGQISGFMGKYFEMFGYGWTEMRRNVTARLKKKDAISGTKRPHDAYVRESDESVTNEVELPFYAMLGKNPIESLHYFQRISDDLYKKVGETGLRSPGDADGRKLVFFLEIIRDLQENLEGAPARKQQYLLNLRQKISQTATGKLDNNSKELLVSRIFPVVDTKIEEYRNKATMMGSEYVVSPRSNRRAANRPIEELLGRK